MQCNAVQSRLGYKSTATLNKADPWDFVLIDMVSPGMLLGRLRLLSQPPLRALPRALFSSSSMAEAAKVINGTEIAK
jgi:hypothetical protein